MTRFAGGVYVTDVLDLASLIVLPVHKIMCPHDRRKEAFEVREMYV